MPPVAVKLTQPKRGEIARNVTLPATVAANQQTMLYGKVTGYLKNITVDKGDAVTAGQLLAEIETPELLADLTKNKAEAAIAALDFKRASDAQKKAADLIPLQTVDAARAKYEMAKASQDRVETLLGFCKITAPFAGVVTKRLVDPGAYITTTTPLLTIADFITVRVQVAVPESEVPLIAKGLPVKVTVEELPGKGFDGTVTRFAHALDEQSKTMLAEIDLPNDKGSLRPGMYAMVKISVEKHADALLLPVDGVMVEKSGASVFTAADNKAKKHPVKMGFNDGTNIEILDGVQASDQIILVGKMTLSDNQAVTVTEKP